MPTSFGFFALITFSFSTSLRDIMIGEWDVFPADSDFTKTSYTIEFHQSSYDPLDMNSLNCTLWKDDSMHSYLPSSFIFNQQGPLVASLQISFNSDFSGSIYNIKTRNFNQDLNTNEKFNTKFSFDSTSEKISRFKIDRYTFVIDISNLNKDGQISVEVSSSIDEKDSSIISSKNRYIVIRTKEFENKYMTKQKQTAKKHESNSDSISHEPIETKVTNKIKGILDKMEIDVPDSYILLILAILIMLIIFLISKIIAACFISSGEKKKVKTGTAKKARKHKKKASSLENKKEEIKSKDEEEVNQNKTAEDDENHEKVEDKKENSQKIKTD